MNFSKIFSNNPNQPFSATTPPDIQKFSEQLLDSFIGSLRLEELPEPVFLDHEVSDISKSLANKKAALHLTEFNRVANLMDKVISPVIMLTKARDDQGQTIAHTSIQRNSLPLLKLCMLFEPALINTADKKGIAPISLAAIQGNVEMIQWLGDPSPLEIDLKADPNHVDGKGQGPLHLAAQHGHLACVSKLLEFGADKEKRDCLDMTAADWAFYKYNQLEDDLQAGKFKAIIKELRPQRGLLSIQDILVKLTQQ